MRETYVAPAGGSPTDAYTRARRASTAQRAGFWRAMVAVVLDAVAIAFAAVLLWLGAGTTVLSGDPVVMTLAFTGAAVIASVSNMMQLRSRTIGAITVALGSTTLLAGAYVLQVSVVQSYFFSWVVVFAGAFVAARASVALVIDAFASRGAGALVWRLIAVTVGIAAIVLLNVVWSDSTLLADLVVFVVLMSVASVLFELGIRSFRASLKTQA